MIASLQSPTLLVALAAMLWGSDVLLRKNVLSSGWSPARVVLGEHVLLALVFLPILWREFRILARLSHRRWAALLFVSWGGSALATWLYTQAFTLGAPLPVILLQKIQPVFALALAWWLLGERRRVGFWGWCVLALAGAWLLTGITQAPSLHDVHTQQALFALGAAVLWGGATVAGRFLSPALSPSLLAGARFSLAVPVLALFVLMTPASPPPLPGAVPPVAHTCLFLLLIVLLPDLAGMGLYYVGLRGTTASAATLAELCYPLTSLLIGITVQHTPLLPTQWIGFAILLLSVLGLSRSPAVVVAGRPAAFRWSRHLPDQS